MMHPMAKGRTVGARKRATSQRTTAKAKAPRASTTRVSATGKAASKISQRIAPETLRAEVRRTHGLTLPEHLLDFAARWSALPRADHDLVEAAVGFTPAGVLAELTASTRARVASDVEPCLRARHELDPPEFLLVALASDGTRIGLWYDDDRLAPSFLMRYAPGDDATLVYAGTSLHEALRRAVDDAYANSAEETGEAPASPMLARARVIAESLPLPRPPIGAPPAYDDAVRVATSTGARLWAPGKRLGRRYAETDPAAARKLLRAPPDVWQSWVDKARADCMSGEPVEALALGHDLHHLATPRAPERAVAATDLLVAAYRALGREALARIAEAQHRHRKAPPPSAPAA